MKRCTVCGSEKPLEDFHRNPSTKDRRSSSCKSCACERTRRWTKDNPERVRERNRLWRENNREENREYQRRWMEENREAVRANARRNYVRRKYNLAVEEYETLISSRCEVCGADSELVCDHDHETGAVRGALCNGCNTGLGSFRDDPDRLRAAADYIEAHRASREKVPA